MESSVPDILGSSYGAFEVTQLRLQSGLPLTVFERGSPECPCAILISPIGVPLAVMERLAHRLSQDYRVVCWEQRVDTNGASEEPAGPRSFADCYAELLAVAAARSKSPAVLIGQCSGAALAIQSVVDGALQPQRLVLLSPAVRFTQGYVPSIYDRAYVPYMRRIATGDHRLAQQLIEMRRASEASRAPLSPDDQLVDAADSLCLQSATCLERYAQAVVSFTSQSFDDRLKELSVPTAVFSCADDMTVSIGTARALSQHIPDCRFFEFVTGGHYGLYTSAEYRAAVCEWLKSDSMLASVA
jgi:pimeloyl-ACP methyl ester carboxylesterase